MNNSEKVWVPKPIKQKEVIFFHLPFIKYPVTKRELIFFTLGIPITIPIHYLLLYFFTPKDVVDNIIHYMFLITVPMFMGLLSHKKTNSRYIEETLISKINYKRSASVLVNKKALAALNERKKSIKNRKG